MAIKSEDEEYNPLLANWDREVYNEYQRRTATGDVVSETRGYHVDSLFASSFDGSFDAMWARQSDDSTLSLLSTLEKGAVAYEKEISHRHVATKLLNRGRTKNSSCAQALRIPDRGKPGTNRLSRSDVSPTAYEAIGLRLYVPSSMNPIWQELAKCKELRARIREHPG
ncbi:hypothetical protein LTR78_009499 [Recurvomyces mirabilis]|uniref:Uncharacterized protein n=1 Tax=Recurvomyces mirabilis TaxID=574656 RepID=A0AAE0TNQ9_9PEZI|nr:hypothetical protein LTR78_009499 [Recurvomyces mirabilis]KAK5152403.1 hypothetical protein LTS14_008350 [Recurvomyces mirabilis]